MFTVLMEFRDLSIKHVPVMEREHQRAILEKTECEAMERESAGAGEYRSGRWLMNRS
jgi:hypothetical protein